MAHSTAPYTFEIALDGPIDVAGSIERFRRWGDDGIDRWDGDVLVRTAPSAEGPVPYLARPAGTIQQPRLRVTVASEELRSPIERAVNQMFVGVEPDCWQRLCEMDSVVRALDQRFPGIRPVIEPDPFTALLRSISAQQVNLTWAAVTRRRLAEAFGQRHEIAGCTVYSYAPARLVTADIDDIRQLQLTTSRARSILAVAASLLDGTLDPAALATLPETEVVTKLITVYGIGRWSAEWYLARTLGRPVVVAGDLGVRKAVGTAYLGGALPSESEARAATAHWGASSGVAQQLLLHALVEGVDIKALAG